MGSVIQFKNIIVDDLSAYFEWSDEQKSSDKDFLNAKIASIRFNAHFNNRSPIQRFQYQDDL
jgi:hypothetical protein